MNEKSELTSEIEDYLVNVSESQEYASIEYLLLSIRKNYLHYLSGARLKQFEIPEYLKELVNVVQDKFEKTKISANEMLDYMLEHDINNWVFYYANTFILPAVQGKMMDCVKDVNEFFYLVLTGYIIDTFRDRKIDIVKIVKNERLEHETNQYGLSVVNGVEFKRDYFIFENKAYMYSILTNTDVMEYADLMPAFARIITEKVKTGDILLRLDERLALPLNQAISYSTLNSEKYYGPQFHFKNSVFRDSKTVIIHIDADSCDKLLMVIKQDYDIKRNERFLHVEIETLPYMEGKTDVKHCITTFLHGMYYPTDDSFSHIDCTKNQYPLSDYLKKYSEEQEDISVDLHTEKNLHYKIWCVENGKYSRKIWYELMIVSLPKRYRQLLDEILE